MILPLCVIFSFSLNAFKILFLEPTLLNSGGITSESFKESTKTQIIGRRRGRYIPIQKNINSKKRLIDKTQIHTEIKKRGSGLTELVFRASTLVTTEKDLLRTSHFEISQIESNELYKV